MSYTLAVRQNDHSVKYFSSSEIIALLDATVPLQRAYIRSVQRLEKEGCRYSNQDFDVLSAAFRAVGKSEISPHQAKWVAASLGQ